MAFIHLTIPEVLAGACTCLGVGELPAITLPLQPTSTTDLNSPKKLYPVFSHGYCTQDMG